MTFRYIFKIKVRPGEDEAFKRSWHNGSIPIQKMPGALGTRLHKNHGEDLVYTAIAEWKSRDARIAAFAELDKPDHSLGQEMRRWGKNEDFGEVTPIAEVEEIDHVVLPVEKSQKLRDNKDITPREVYNAALSLWKQGERVTYEAVAAELNVRAPAGFVGLFAYNRDREIRIRKAYYAGRAGRPYPKSLDNPKSDPNKLPE